jgi:maltooligosyltrehalose trehalohydrolase
MIRSADGEFSARVSGAQAGHDYSFVFPEGSRRPDPVSRWQPNGVHKSSRIVDPDDYVWHDGHWAGLLLKDFVFYEAHTGTFTPEGTFEAIIDRLPYLSGLGITALELMPVAEFPGARNWGYDGVSLYAPHSQYGGPAGLKALVDACHQHGLAFVLDVVYNHLGPEGNYLREFGPYFTECYRTPWGSAINFDGPDSDTVRRFFIDNALYWLTEYHVDALRLDAVHGIFDFSARHLLEELSFEFHQQAARLDRQAWLIAESNLNDTRIVRRRDKGGYGIDGQWNDDFHHAFITVLTGRQPGYLSEFGTLADLAKAITDGFVHDGCYSTTRRRRFGNSSCGLPGEQLTVFTQNHDQIANAFSGRRLASLAPSELQKLAAAMLVCTPALPLFFMGQEYGETAPFHYFTSHGDSWLIDAVREGRRREFEEFHAVGAFADPQEESTFEASKLNWDRLTIEPHSWLLKLHTDLLALRKATPALANVRKETAAVRFDENRRWLVLSLDDFLLLCNFSDEAQQIRIAASEGPWKRALWTAAPEYGGNPEAQAPELRSETLVPPSSAVIFRRD